MPADDHKAQAQSQGAVPVAVVTVSDTRTPETDKSGTLIHQLLGEAGHTVVAYDILPDEPDQITAHLQSLTTPEHPCKIIICNGGTGISPRDGTFEAINSILEKTMPGFGELFRMLSYNEIASAAMLSRAVAGTYRGRVVFSTPGSRNAVKLAMQKLILPELQHLAWEIMRE
ncbi:MAG: molybdenum cofactor biosynthesis protein B [Anaerolineales bacterium]